MRAFALISLLAAAFKFFVPSTDEAKSSLDSPGLARTEAALAAANEEAGVYTTRRGM